MMRKVLSAVLVLVLLSAALSLVFANASDGFDYVRITAGGNDPYGKVNFSTEGKNTSIDPDKVKFAAVKYRTITETDNTGVKLIGQFYVIPEAEPFIPVKYNHTQKWETLVVDMTSVSEKATVASKWNSTGYTATNQIRFDPLESNRDAEAQDSEHDTAVVSNGDSIDIAWIAFFESEADAKAYDGTQDTPYCIILPEDLATIAGNNIKSAEILHEDAAVDDDPPSPPSSDAAVVAIAALGCAALAGAIMIRKSK